MARTTTPPRDNRSAVAHMQRLAEQAARRNAPIYSTSPARRAELRGIAVSTNDHHARLRQAMASGAEVTAVEAAQYLDTLQPHARLTELRQGGVLILSRWVSARTASGGTRRLMAYRLPDADA
jgi:Helix-turn-helix domain